MSLTTELREALALINLPMERFRELLTRLLSYGVLVRDEDHTEQLLYDDARRMEGLLVEYFEVAGMTLYHDVNAQFFRLYGPGAIVDGLKDDDLAPVPSLKARLSVDFVAAALALRFLYQEKLTQGNIDGAGEALISFEDLAVAMQTQLKRPLPESASDRTTLLSDLRRHRLVRYASSFATDPDAYLAIRATILGVISNESLSAALDAPGVNETTLVGEAPTEPDTAESTQ